MIITYRETYNQTRLCQIGTVVVWDDFMKRDCINSYTTDRNGKVLDVTVKPLIDLFVSASEPATVATVPEDGKVSEVFADHVKPRE